MLVARDQSDDRKGARMHLETALDIAQQDGCTLVEQRALELLNQL